MVNGGVYRVQGPTGTFIGGNNEMALALVMTIPLMRYLHLQEKNKLIKLGLAIGMLLTALAAVGSQSRGALVGLALMGTMFWLKSRNKFATALLIAVAAVGRLSGHARRVVPAHGHHRDLRPGCICARAHQYVVDGMEPGQRPDLRGGLRVLAGPGVQQLRAGPKQRASRAQHLLPGLGRPRLGRLDPLPVVAGADVAQVQRGDPAGEAATRCQLGARPGGHDAGQHRGLHVGRCLPGPGLLRLRLPPRRGRCRRPCPDDQTRSGRNRYPPRRAPSGLARCLGDRASPGAERWHAVRRARRSERPAFEPQSLITSTSWKSVRAHETPVSACRRRDLPASGARVSSPHLRLPRRTREEPVADAQRRRGTAAREAARAAARGRCTLPVASDAHAAGRPAARAI